MRITHIVAIVLSLMTAGPLRADSDVVVYGGTSGGVTTAVQAARLGKTVVLVEPGKHLGGMTSGGLGWTDMGRPEIVGGISREFYGRIFQRYEQKTRWRYGTYQQMLRSRAQHAPAIDEKSRVMWLFEPHVAEEVFQEMAQEPGLEIVFGERLDRKNGVTKQGNRIVAMKTESGKVFRGKVYIDATYEGDLMAAAGVTYVVGREANSQYGETINGIQTARATKNQLPAAITGAGLPGINPNPGDADGAADSKIQAYCYRMCLTDVEENRVTVAKPDGYNENDYELLFRAIEAGQADKFFKLDLVPNRKTDSNNTGGISTDWIGMNYAYPEGSYEDRQNIAQGQERWQRGLLWTLQNHPRVPAKIREKYAKWGLAKDEFADTGNWPHQLYVREARRMVGDLVVTEKSVVDDNAARPVALGGYSMDSHNVQRHLDDKGHVRNEGDVQISVKRPYRIDYGCLLPRERECANLLVPFCVSATHAAFSTIRMEPVFMELGQCAGVAASLAIDAKTSVQGVEYPKLRDQLIKDGAVLEWQDSK